MVVAVVVVANFMHTPSSLLLQWHITERCNLRCSHCYQDNYARDELNYADLLKILEQFKKLLAILNHRAGKTLRAHITVTGGEPFAQRDFMDLLEVFAAHRQLFSFAILSNGSFIDATMAQRLRELAPRFVQVSIEGTAETHDNIRGKGNFAKTIEAIKKLRQEKIPTFISFTAHRKNFQEFPQVAQLGVQLKVAKIWADRLIPCGSGTNLREQVMNPEETKAFFKLMAKAQKTPGAWFSRTEIAMHRALQFLVAGGRPYHCTAGDSLLTIQANGDLYPCRRMPIRIGNLLETSLIELYDNSDFLHKLRDNSEISETCQKCFHAKFCRGGLKCLSYAVTGNPFKTDPGCWISTD